jgi:putative glutamine amidotransferase
VTHDLPLIAVTGRISPTAERVRGEAFASGQGYSTALVRAGAQPVILPPVVDGLDLLPAALERIDGVVLHGGGDVDPRRYGEVPSSEALFGIVTEHDDFELAVLRAALDRELPVLAICRGLQLLNVAMGGTLHQDLGTEDHWHTTHPIDVDPDSRLARALGTTRPHACHSVHHQAINCLADGLRVVASADDGVIEAVEVDSPGWLVAVQWHPEDTASDDPVQQRLFDTLVDEARAFRRSTSPSEAANL